MNSSLDEVVELPFEPADVIPAILTGDRGAIGERLTRFIVGLLESPEARPRITGLVRAAATDSLPAESLVAAIGPTFQRYLTEPLAA